MRERSRGTKLEGAYRKRKGWLLENSNHTILFLPTGCSQSIIISQRDIGKDVANQPCCSKWPLRTQTPTKSNNSSETEVSSESGLSQSTIGQPAEIYWNTEDQSTIENHQQAANTPNKSQPSNHSNR